MAVWCSCCGRDHEATTCPNCTSRVYCACGALLSCGGHWQAKDHRCPAPQPFLVGSDEGFYG